MIVAGEASGDMHGARLAREIMAIEPTARLFGMGGSRMRSAECACSTTRRVLVPSVL